MVRIDLPVPFTFVEVIWFAMGLLFGRAFGKNVDYEVQQSDWFKNLDPRLKWILKRTLDFAHHWWIGAFIMLSYEATEIFLFGRVPMAPYWFGLGLLLDDIPDVPRRIREMLGYLWFKEEKEP